jgi:LPS export ABC transporter protein LptC
LRKYVRLIVAAFGIVFAVFVALQFRRRPAEPPATAVTRTDPGAVVESTDGTTSRFKFSRQDVLIAYDHQLTYGDGTVRLVGVKIIADERGSGKRTFNVTAKEGKVGKDEAELTLIGDVNMSASDGMVVRTEQARYAKADGQIRAPGHVEFTRGRLSGSGVGMVYDEGRDVLSLLADASVHIAPDKQHAGGADVTSGKADFARRDKNVRFDENVRIQRENQTIDADNAVGYLSADEDHIEKIELRGHSRIAMAKAAVGAVQGLTATDMDLKYSPDGLLLEHATIDGDASIQLAGEAGAPGRQIAAKTIDITLAPDGATPTALIARESVLLTLPPDGETPGRTIRSAALDAKGEPQKGLNQARFAGTVEFREQGNHIDRRANSAILEVALKPGFVVEDARFEHAVRFVDGRMTAVAAAGRYDLGKGTLALSGSEPAFEVPHMVNEQIAVDGKTVNVTLNGPKVKAEGAPVKSVLQPAKKQGDKPAEGERRMPAMLKSDQAVTVLSKTLDYDGTASKSTYAGEVRLFQADTSIKAATIVLDDKSGDLTASGGVTTTTLLEQNAKAVADKEKEKNKTAAKPADTAPVKERVLSIATAKDFVYEDNVRRLTYTGDAHMTGPQGDMTASKIELYLKPSGDELERAEAYEKLTLREQNRTTTGNRLTYTTADEKYVITGAPVEITDECSRVTTGHTLTFVKATDTIVVDGNDQIRTQTKGGGKCPS